jgi:integrase
MFASWLGGRDLLSATRADVENWLVHLHQSCRPATVLSRYMGLRRFYDWLLAEEEIAENPFGSHGARRIRPPEVPETHKQVVSPDDMLRVFRLLDRQKRWRDAVVIAVLYDTGMRASELAQALTENVDLDAGTILLERTKGRRPRLVGIAPETIRYIDRYWRQPRSAMTENVPFRRWPFACHSRPAGVSRPPPLSRGNETRAKILLAAPPTRPAAPCSRAC